jgi:NAD(P)-dependent dehydrogenase (short-subunit alcohol dehydrogenase family)
MLDKRTAIVTGGGSGIGRDVALLYAVEGASVLVSDVDEAGGNETVAMVKKKGGRGQLCQSRCRASR